MKDKEYIETLIARLLNGNCTSEELQELKNWIEESPDHKKEYLAIKDIWDFSKTQPDRAEGQLALFYKNRFEKVKKSQMRWIRYSSTVAALLILGLLISILIPQNTTNQPNKFQVFSVPLGSKSKVLLADGSEVSLNSGSELKYSSNYLNTNRVVYLTGEGFFHVKSDRNHPFIVKTADFEVKVTGTQFNVCSYPENLFSSTILAEGEIQLKMNGSDQTFEIKPNQKFELKRATRKYILGNADVESEIAWKDGKFIFRNIPFPELVRRLERWYDVKLNYSDVWLQNFAYTGKFVNQETIWQVLDALKLTSPIDYRKTTCREFELKYKPLKQQ